MNNDVKKSLEEASLLNYFNSLSPSRQNEYLRWIGEAKKEETKTKRINKMIEMLRSKQV